MIKLTAMLDAVKIY